jgi:hypothetical protein
LATYSGENLPSSGQYTIKHDYFVFVFWIKHYSHLQLNTIKTEYNIDIPHRALKYLFDIIVPFTERTVGSRR